MPSSDPERAQLEAQYAHALDEYRFQVELNWKRSQYFLVLNLGVLVAAIGLLSSRAPRAELVAALFVLGALLAAVSIHANRVQHSYYVRTREVKRSLERALGLNEHALQPTPGMRDSASGRRPMRVRDALDLFLVALGTADLIGVVLVVSWYA